MTGWAIARVIPLWFDDTQATGLTAAFELRVRERAGRAPLRLTLDVHDGTPCRSSNRASGKAARIGSQLRKFATSASTRRSSDTRRSYA